MRILVTGERGFHDKATFNGALNRVHARHGIERIIQGDREGANWLAAEWAADNGADVLHFNKKSHRHIIENGKPDAAIAFGSTAIVQKLKDAGISVWEIAPKP